jgi:hypothetical protein
MKRIQVKRLRAGRFIDVGATAAISGVMAAPDAPAGTAQ